MILAPANEAVHMLQILAETLRIARLRIKELEAETNIQTTEINRLMEYVNASESAGRTMYGQQVDELKQVRQHLCAAMAYKRRSWHIPRPSTVPLLILYLLWYAAMFAECINSYILHIVGMVIMPIEEAKHAKDFALPHLPKACMLLMIHFCMLLVTHLLNVPDLERGTTGCRQ